MRVTIKGQVTIPIEIREKLGITPDTEVDFLQEGDRVFLVKRKGTDRATRRFKKLRGIATVKMTTEEIMALEPLAEKWKAFGWEVIEIDGSNINEMIQAFNKTKRIIKKPKVIISYFIKGADVSFMEHTKKYHGRPPNQEEYEIAIKEIEKIKKNII